MAQLPLRTLRKRRYQRPATALMLVLLSNTILSVSLNLFSTVTVEAFAAPKHQRKEAPSRSSTGSQKRRAAKAGGNQNWYNKRKSGIKVQSRGPKPPKWEKEGDDLYLNHNINSKDDSGSSPESSLATKKDWTVDEARKILRPFELKTSDSADELSTVSKPSTSKPKVRPSDDMPFMWGGLSVGPVWKSRLVEAGFPKPTPIQIATYANLSNKKNQTSINGNAVIAASTGSGKSLAYLLPFLTSIDTNNRKKKEKQAKQSNPSAEREPSNPTASVTDALGKIWIVTPTMELAYQLQRTVDNVIVGKGGESSSDVVHVVEYKRDLSTRKESSFSASFPILSDIVDRYYGVGSSPVSQEPTFLAGTPKLFVQMRKEIKKVLASTTKVDSNLRYAKQREARKLREESEGIPSSDDENDTDKTNVAEQMLFRKVALAIENNLETLILDEVDRLLQTTTALTRREHKTTKPLAQELLESLVWESRKKPLSSRSFGKKKTPASFAPSSYSSKLQIVCASATVGRSLRRQLMYITKAPSMDKAAVLITADVRTKKHAELRKASLLPSNLKHSYQIISFHSEKKESAAAAAASATLESLVNSLRAQDPQAPSLVFPGTIGVETVRDHLLTAGFTDIRGLSSLRDENRDKNQECDAESSVLDTPVYVVKERLARGLDLPEVRRVFLLGVPSNAAAYAHLAGRTARQNTPGECTVLCKPSDAPKLVSIAETLGLYRWRCLDPMPSTDIEAERGGDDWDIRMMTKTEIKSKKVSQLREFLEGRNISTKGLLKDSLVDAVLQLKDGAR